MDNKGKAAAVWLGIAAGLVAASAIITGLFDADPATPDWGAVVAAFMAAIAVIFRGTK